MPDPDVLVIVGLIGLALLFDFTNGFHDAANSIATVVSTRVLSPRVAVAWAAVFNFVAFLVFQTKVADTVGKTVDSSVVSEAVIFGGLIGAIGWNLLTWWLGLPTSSSHALIGGFAGAGIAKAGFGVVDWESMRKTIAFIPLAPLLGLALGVAIMVAAIWAVRRLAPRRVDELFRKLQLVSAAAFSLGHGGNDAQKTMGIISALLVGTGYLHKTADGKLPVPLWIVLSAHAAIALGTLMGGWRIVKTLGQRITDLKPIGGFSAESAAASSLYLATWLGIPVSTTHTITGAIVGVGSLRRLSAVRWGVASRVVWAWVVTIPSAALFAAAAYGLVTGSAAGLVIALVLVVVVGVLVWTQRRQATEEARRARAPRPPEPPEEPAAEAKDSVTV
jgi:PiT family inorganic phosphate transporter